MLLGPVSLSLFSILILFLSACKGVSRLTDGSQDAPAVQSAPEQQKDQQSGPESGKRTQGDVKVKFTFHAVPPAGWYISDLKAGARRAPTESENIIALETLPKSAFKDPCNIKGELTVPNRAVGETVIFQGFACIVSNDNRHQRCAPDDYDSGRCATTFVVDKNLKASCEPVVTWNWDGGTCTATCQ